MSRRRDDEERGTVAGTLARRYPVSSFVLVTFAWSWGYWTLVAVFVDADSVSYLVTLPGLWGPFAAAVVVARLRGTRVRSFLGRVLRPDVGVGWYAVAVGGPFAFGAVIGVAQGTIAGTGFDLAVIGPVVGLVVAVFAGGSEEVGLRGFAHPHLRERYGALTAGVVIGAVWAVWHVPLMRLGVGFDGSFVYFAAATVALSVLFGWLFDASGSAIPVVVAHAAIDAPDLVGPAGTVPGDLAVVGIVLYWGAVAVLVVKNGTRLTNASERPSADLSPDGTAAQGASS